MGDTLSSETFEMDPAGQDDCAQADRTYLPGNEDPSASLDKPLEKAETPAAERIAALYERMGAYQGVLDSLMAMCREAQPADDVDARAAELLGKAFCVYAPSTFARLLVQAGALEKIVAEKAEPQVVEVNGVQYLDVEAAETPAQPDLLLATPEGLAVLEGRNSLDRFEAVLAEDERYLHIYQVLLDLCANDGGASAAEMGDAVDSDPELQEPRMYASYFFDRLAQCGLLEWKGAWCATDLGRQAIDWLAVRA